MFNIRKLLRDKKIPFQTDGKNISAGWTGIRCPFPGCADRSNHCGISPDGSGFSCWICGTRGHISKLLWQLFPGEVDQLLSKYFDGTVSDVHKKSPSRVLKKPKGLSPTFTAYHKNYFRKRGYNLNTTARILRLSGVLWGVYIPVYLNGKEVSYVVLKWPGGRSVYIDSPIEDSIVPVKQTLFNVDNCFDRAVIVEGFFDVLRFGIYGACATMTTNFTEEQIGVIREKGFKKVVVMFDGEPNANRKEEELANKLSVFVPEVYTVGLQEGDPDEAPDEVIQEVKDLLNG